MDQRAQDELKSLGFVGIYKHSFKAIFGSKKMFTLIYFALILPICILSMFHSKVAETFFGKILKNHDLGAYDTDDDDSGGEWAATYGKYGWVSLWLLKVIYLVPYFALSLLPTSVIANAMFAIYTNKHNATFTNAIITVPKSFKKLAVTFLWSFGVYFIFNFIFFGMLVIWVKFIWRNYSIKGITIIIVITVLYFGILPYLIMIWQLANVVSVLENVYGREALRKGWALMKGKRCPYITSYALLLVLLAAIHTVFLFAVRFDSMFRSGGGFVLVLAFILVLMILELLRLVTATVVYLVCKSYHHEDVDGPILTTPGKVKDVPPQQL